MKALVIALCAIAVGLPASAASPEKGKATFVAYGCWQCHGYEGQGSVAGGKLAPNPLPLEAMSAFVRNTRGSMPPYSKSVLADEDLADIHAYLASLPKMRDPRSIPELDVITASPRSPG
jgi:ubiquinol-cytochrome c reductase cytochrome c subunit